MIRPAIAPGPRLHSGDSRRVHIVLSWVFGTRGSSFQALQQGYAFAFALQLKMPLWGPADKGGFNSVGLERAAQGLFYLAAVFLLKWGEIDGDLAA